MVTPTEVPMRTKAIDAAVKARRATRVLAAGSEASWTAREKVIQEFRAERKGSNSGEWVVRDETIPLPKWECPNCHRYSVVPTHFDEEDWVCQSCTASGFWSALIDYYQEVAEKSEGKNNFYRELIAKALLAYLGEPK